MHQIGITIDTRVVFDTADSEGVKSCLKFGWKVSSIGSRRNVDGRLDYTVLIRNLILGEALEGTGSFVPNLHSII